MTFSQPRVSVCIPSYQGEAYIGAAIQSVLAQTYGDLELIVVDDDSRDATGQVVTSCTDARLSWVPNQRNLGPEANWNRCLELARGTYCKLLPQDDLLHPHCLERQVAILDSDPQQRLALVFSARHLLGPDGRPLGRRGYPSGREGPLNSTQVGAAYVRWGTNLIGEPGAVLFRRELALKVGGFDAANPYVIDLDYWLRLLAQGDAYYLDQPLASFRVNPGSWSVAIGKGQSADFRNLVQRQRAAGLLHPSGLDGYVWI